MADSTARCWYFCSTTGEVLGPLDEMGLTEAFEGSLLTPKSLVWNGSSVPKWTALVEIPGLLQRLRRKGRAFTELEMRVKTISDPIRKKPRRLRSSMHFKPKSGTPGVIYSKKSSRHRGSPGDRSLELSDESAEGDGRVGVDHDSSDDEDSMLGLSRKLSRAMREESEEKCPVSSPIPLRPAYSESASMSAGPLSSGVPALLGSSSAIFSRHPPSSGMGRQHASAASASTMSMTATADSTTGTSGIMHSGILDQLPLKFEYSEEPLSLAGTVDDSLGLADTVSVEGHHFIQHSKDDTSICEVSQPSPHSQSSSIPDFWFSDDRPARNTDVDDF